MRCWYREKSYKCGDYKEVYIYPVFAEQAKGGARRRKAKPTSEAQQRLNKRISENNLIRLLNANFTKDDIAFDLTYKNETNPTTNEQAKRDLSNFFRRLKRFRKQKGLSDLKYIAVTERGERKGRVHHHIVMSGGVSINDLAKLWGKGYTKAQPLQFDETGLIGKGKYMTKQALFFRSFNASKNLIHPQPTKRDGRLSNRKAMEMCVDIYNKELYERLYEGYAFAEANSFYNEVNGGVYLVVRLYKKELTFKRWGKKKRKKKVRV